MRSIRQINPVVRAIGVISAVVVLATSVTFAALQSQATLTNSSITSATAGLQLFDTATNSYGSVGQGFTVTNLIPGTPQEFAFYARNNGSAPLALSVTVPSAPTASGFTGWENVKVVITDDNGATSQMTMADLLAGPVSLNGDPFSVGSIGDNSVTTPLEGNFKISFDINPSAITGSSASVGGFNLDFVGTQTTE